MDSVKQSLLKALDHNIKDIARYRRMVELAPEIHDMTTAEFDELLNEKCETYHEKYSSMDMFEVIVDGAADAFAIDAKQNGPEAAGERLANIFNKMGDK